MTKIEKEADKYAKKFSPWLYSTLVECFKKGAECQCKIAESGVNKYCESYFSTDGYALSYEGCMTRTDSLAEEIMEYMHNEEQP